MRQAILTSGAPKPSGAYSQAIRVGDLVFTAGMAANDPETGALLYPGDIGRQTTRTLENLQAALEAAGTSLAHAVRVGAFLHDIREWGTFNAAYVEFFSRFAGPRPARTTVSVGNFPEGMCVEIDVIAAIPGGS
jgi:2-iminobutanoate/2-iminopropanoate deaminase